MFLYLLSIMSYIYRCVASIYFKVIHFQVRCWTETWDLEGVRHKVSTLSALFRFLFFFLVAMFHILGFAFSLCILFTTKISNIFTISLLHQTCSGSTFQPSASFMDQPRERTALSTLETKRRGETIFCKVFEKLFLFAQGACGFLPRLINYNPFALIRWNIISWRYFSTASWTHLSKTAI